MLQSHFAEDVQFQICQRGLTLFSISNAFTVMQCVAAQVARPLLHSSTQLPAASPQQAGASALHQADRGQQNHNQREQKDRCHGASAHIQFRPQLWVLLSQRREL